MNIGPGIFREIISAHYHEDPCPEPSLSASIAKILLEKSPRHAFARHPRLTPGAKGEASTEMDIGSVAHSLLLGKGADIVIVDAKDWRTKAAQEQRDQAREDGGTPILRHQLENAERMVAAARKQMADIGIDDEFSAGESESVMIWRDEGGIWCRSMLDKLCRSENEATIYDFKTTSASAHPAALGRFIADMGYDIAAGFYARGLATLFPELLGRITFRWIVQEITEPYGLSVVELDGAGKVIGAKKAACAVALWRQCMERESWPLYPTGIVRVEYPTFHMQRWLTRETEDPMIADLVATPMLPEPARHSAPLDEFTP